MEQHKLLEEFTKALTGRNLTEVLESKVNSYLGNNNMTRGKLIESIALNAGVHSSTINAILKGKIKKPPRKRLESFASVLSQ